MSKTSAKSLATKAAYNKLPAVQDKRVEQNRARRHAEAKGLAHKGDGTNVDHKKMLDLGGSGADSNTRVVSEKANKGWRKDHPEAYTKARK